jgi:hypothetical protein
VLNFAERKQPPHKQHFLNLPHSGNSARTIEFGSKNDMVEWKRFVIVTGRSADRRFIQVIPGRAILSTPSDGMEAFGWGRGNGEVRFHLRVGTLCIGLAIFYFMGDESRGTRFIDFSR